MPEVKEVRKQIMEAAQRFRIPTSKLADRLDDIEKDKKKVKGVWAVDGWMWIAVEQGTKFTWSGYVFSPIVGSGEYGSWYIDEPIGAVEVVKPEFRWKLPDEEIQNFRKKRQLLGFM